MIPMRNVFPASSTHGQTEGGCYHQGKVFIALLFFFAVEKLIHKTTKCVWHCNCTTRPLQVTCSTHSFQLNISHLKPVKSCSFILLNPALHDRTSLGASPSSPSVVWCGVMWCVVCVVWCVWCVWCGV